MVALLVLGLALVAAMEAQAPAPLPSPLVEAGGFTPPEPNVSGIVYDGRSLWLTIDQGFALYEVDPDSGAVKRKLPLSIRDTGGSAWDGRYLWQLAYAERTLHQIDLERGQVVRTLPSPGKGLCSGITFDGRYLWAANFDDRKIYQVDLEDGGRVVRSISGEFETTGIAWDGQHLWSGILVGTKEHDEPTPFTGFVQQRETERGHPLAAVPLAGVGPGTSDWPYTQGGGRFWWYDGYHNRIVLLRPPPPQAPLRRTGLGLLLAVCLALGFMGWSHAGQPPARATSPTSS